MNPNDIRRLDSTSPWPTTNEFGFLQYVDKDGDAVCPDCQCLVHPNRGEGAMCSRCAYEAEMEMSHDRF